jgi:aminoglycoside phosphotransferase (APT) family kinase protein
VRAEIEDRLGAAVSDAESMPGGFTPGLAAALTDTSGKRTFVKAITANTTPGGPAIYRREAAIASALPAATPAPRLLWWFEEQEWVVLAFEQVEGRMPDVRRPEDLGLVLRAYTQLSSMLTPAPVDVPTFAEAFHHRFGSWQAMYESETPVVLAASAEWVPAAREQLAALESGWMRASQGTTLLHGDLRADNMLITKAGKVVAVDWPEACIGASWVDLVLALPSFALAGIDPDPVLRGHPLTRRVADEDIDALVAAVAGFFISRSLLPPPAGLPTVRQFQRAQGEAALGWLLRRNPLLAP